MGKRIPVERVVQVLSRHGFSVMVVTPENFRLATGESEVTEEHRVAAHVVAALFCAQSYECFLVIARRDETRCFKIENGQVGSKCYRHYVHKFGVYIGEFFA